jgi:hypothetical protein
MSSRILGLICYTVVPNDPTNSAQNAQTEALLRNIDRSAVIIPKRTAGEAAIWFLKSHNAALEAAISTLEGVSIVKKEASSRTSSHGIRHYIASALESSNIEETEAFLNSKIQCGTEYRRILCKDVTTVLGWAGLALDREAAQVVEEYEGIAYPLGIEDISKLQVFLQC